MLCIELHVAGIQTKVATQQKRLGRPDIWYKLVVWETTFILRENTFTCFSEHSDMLFCFKDMMCWEKTAGFSCTLQCCGNCLEVIIAYLVASKVLFLELYSMMKILMSGSDIGVLKTWIVEICFSGFPACF
jgi:hypothetical protein